MENDQLLKAQQDYVNLRARLAEQSLFIKPSPFKSAEQASKEAARDAKNSIDDLRTSCEKGFSILIENLNDEEQSTLFCALEPLKSVSTEKIKELIESGLFVHQALGISDEAVNILYRVGKKLLNESSYENAYHVFLILAILCPQSLEVWLGLGKASQEINKQEEADIYYQRALELNPQSAVAQAYAKQSKNSDK